MVSSFRDEIETGFESWGRFVVARPFPVLLASLAVAFTCMTGLPRVYVDVSFEAFLGQEDAVRVDYEAFRDQFGRDERILIAFDRGEATGPEGVFGSGFLERLRDFHDAVEERIPYLVEVTSLVNARDTRGEGDTLVVEDFLEPWPEDPDEIARLRTRALENPLFRNTVISIDGDITTLAIELELYSQGGVDQTELGGFDDTEAGGEGDGEAPLLSGTETAEVVDGLRALIAEFEAPDFVIHMAGSPVLLQTIGGSMLRDMPRFVGLAIATIALLLLILFRRPTAVVIPLIVVVLSVASTIGLMGWSGTPIHVPTQILPSFLLAVAIGDSVHLLTIFLERLRAGESREDALPHALGHSGLAIVLTSLTTAAGLVSFASSGVEPVAMIGVFAPVGVLFALFLSLTLLPACLAIAPLGASRGRSAPGEENLIDRLLARFGRFASRHATGILVCALLGSVVAGLAATRLELSHNPLTWMPDDSTIAKDTHFIDERLGGTVSFEVVLESPMEGGVRDPSTLERLAELGESFEQDARDGLIAGQTTSLADVVREINRALNADRAESYTIPADPLLVAQELLLFENTGTDDLEDLTNTRFDRARMSVRMPWRDAVRYQVFFREARADAEAALSEFGRPALTGVLALLVRAIGAMVTSIAQSYVLAFLVITPIMILLLGDLKLGLVSMIPNALPILFTLGFMGAFGVPLDTFSLMVGGIALGLAVDDTIHFMHNYRRYRRRGMDLEAAVAETLHTSGRAMLVTTIVLSAGFLGFVMSSMVNLTNFGLLIAFAITTAFFADVLLAPALLARLDRDQAPYGG